MAMINALIQCQDLDKQFYQPICSDIIPFKMNNDNSYLSTQVITQIYSQLASLKSELELALYTNALLTKNSIAMSQHYNNHATYKQASIKVQQGEAMNNIKEEERQQPNGHSFKKIQAIHKRNRKKKIEKIKKEPRDRNETKNIPKNYGKAILGFIQKNIQKNLAGIKPILVSHKASFADMMMHIKRYKRKVNSINYLKVMWGVENKDNPINKCIRILSYMFMRKYCWAYIFNSRVKNYGTHIKYKQRIMQGIANPGTFTSIKQF